MLDKLECMNNNKCESPAGGLSFENNSVDSFGFTRTFVYIDGFNLYHGVNKLADKTLKWCNLSKLFYNFTQPNEKIHSIKFFTSRPTHINSDIQKLHRHDNYTKIQKDLGIEIINGKFAKREVRCKSCNNHGLQCNECNKNKLYEHEEKQTDVNLAIKVLSDAFIYKPKNIIICSADTDFIPVINTIKEYKLSKQIKIVIPPQSPIHNDIRIALANFYKIKVNSGNEKLSISIMNDIHLQKSKLPNSITLQDGTVITNPYI